ncbi:CesT family type III secretion system chaperone [uncultured Shewanella sp.]|uniref:CesT family type III secretion system chaperone n=1 Tax=uncultured Shewanella sp. TaxID=173975 RepID=UPI002629B157|nr:CesT family type III secretion system chaperone [uncultured Shewanella sp.]
MKEHFQSLIHFYFNNKNLTINNNIVTLTVNDKLEINIIYIEETFTIHISAYISEIKDNERINIYERLLIGNYLCSDSADGTLGICPDKKHIVYSYKTSASINDIEFKDCINSIIEKSLKFKNSFSISH